MRKTTFLALVLMIAASFSPVISYAHSTLTPTQGGGCPTYLTTLAVDLVNSVPTTVTVGTVVVTTVHVVYRDGTPVTLLPQTMTFLWVGAAGSMAFDNVPVTFTGNPGYYNYTQTVTADLAQSTVGSSGSGKVSIYVVGCSCQDVQGNRGPTGNMGSDETLTPSDNSHVTLGPQTSTQPQQPASYSVPIAIAILLILALLLFLRRSRKKKK